MNHLMQYSILISVAISTAFVSTPAERHPNGIDKVHTCDEIVPLVEISPGETKELVLACSKTMMSRGGGLRLLKIHRTSEGCLLYTSPSPRDLSTSRMPSSA